MFYSKGTDMSQNKYGLDIGSSNFKMCFRDQVLNEKNMIAVTRKEVVGIGDDAYDMYEKVPENIDVSFPVKGGVIADIYNMQILLSKFWQKINGTKRSMGVSDFFIAVPRNVTDVEKRAFYELVVRSGIKVRNILEVDKPVADAVGAGIDVQNAKGIMIVDIGAETCEMSVLSLGGIVESKSVKIGGNRLDEDIIYAVRNEYNLVIGNKTAERLKIGLACAGSNFNSISMTGFGRNVLTGLPTSCQISDEVINSSIKEPLSTIVEEVRIFLENTPPEFAVDIIKNGIFMTGGTSGIRNIDELFRKNLNVSIKVVNTPQESIIRGLMRIMADSRMSSLAYVPDDRLFE